MPDPVFLPRSLLVPGLKKVTVTPQADGSIDVTANFATGTLNVSGPLSFNPVALLKLLSDMAQELPTLVADISAVFASSPPVPLPAPTPTPKSPTQ